MTAKDDIEHEIDQQVTTVEVLLNTRGKGHVLQAIRAAMAELDDEEKALVVHMLHDEVVLRLLNTPRPMSEVDDA